MLACAFWAVRLWSLATQSIVVFTLAHEQAVAPSASMYNSGCALFVEAMDIVVRQQMHDEVPFGVV